MRGENEIKNQDFFKKQQTQLKKNKKFQEYIRHKITKIQQTKSKTIRITEKYFQEIQQKLSKYLQREQKKLLTSYESIVNSSVNCLDHSFFFELQKQVLKLQHIKNYRKKSQNINLNDNSEQNNKQTRKASEDGNQHEIGVKIQIKRFLEQMIITQNCLHEKYKLVGDGIKTEVQKLIQPLNELFYKIPTLASIHQKIVTVANKESSFKEKPGIKQSNKMKFRQKQKINPEKIKLSDIEFLSLDSGQNVVTEKLFKKQAQQLEKINHIVPKKKLRMLPLKPKQDEVCSKVSKMKKQDKILKKIDQISDKKFLFFYEQIVLNQNQQRQDFPALVQEDQNNEARQQKIIQLCLNEKVLWSALEQGLFEDYCKIEFQSKPGRQYLLLLISTQKIINFQKFKNYKIYIFNYKGSQIVGQSLKIQRISDEKAVYIGQMSCLKEYFFVVLNHQVVRFNLMNQYDRKHFMLSRNQKIIRAQAINQSLTIYQGRNKLVKILSPSLEVLHILEWTSLFPLNMNLGKFYSVNIFKPQQVQLNDSQEVRKTEQNNFHSPIQLILPAGQTDSLMLIDRGIQKSIQIQFVQNDIKKENYLLEEVIQILSLHNEFHLLISGNSNKKKSKVYLLQIKSQTILTESKDQCLEPRQRLSAKAYFLDSFKEKIISGVFLNNKIYLLCDSGKLLPYILQ